MEKLIENLMNATELSSYEIASKACTDYFETANENEKDIIRKAILKKATMILVESKESSKKAGDFIAQFSKKEVIIEVDGVKYPLSDWLTIKDYCNTFGLKTTSIVTNWAKRGLIPKENILSLPQLNLKLIKAVPYK